MQEIYKNVSKVMVDTRQNSNLLYLPLDKLMQQAGKAVVPSATGDGSTDDVGAVISGNGGSNASGNAAANINNNRTRDDLRSRESR